MDCKYHTFPREEALLSPFSGDVDAPNGKEDAAEGQDGTAGCEGWQPMRSPH